MSSSTPGREWDQATRRYVYWSSSRGCYVDSNDRPVRDPRTTPAVTSSTEPSSSRSRGASSQSSTAPGRSSGMNVQDTADSVRALNMVPSTAQGTLSGTAAGQGPGIRTSTYPTNVSGQRADPQSADRGSSGRTATPYETSVSEQKIGPQSTTQGSSVRPPEYSSSASNQRTNKSIATASYTAPVPVQAPVQRNASQAASHGSNARNTMQGAGTDQRAALPLTAQSFQNPGYQNPGYSTSAPDQRTSLQNVGQTSRVQIGGYTINVPEQRPTMQPTSQASSGRATAHPAGALDQRANLQTVPQGYSIQPSAYPSAGSEQRTASHLSTPASVTPTRGIPAPSPIQRTNVPATGQASSSQTTGHAVSASIQRANLQTIQPPSATRNTGPYQATVSDERTGLQTRWEVTETAIYRDPENVNSNRGLNVKRIRQVGKPARVSKYPERDYKTYRVIEVLLVPPEDVETSNVSRITPTDTGEIRLRRFVIVREIPERNGFEALAIKTYNGRGVGAPGVIKCHHSIVYTSPAPRPQPDELPGRTPRGDLENGMLPQSIRIVQLDRGKALDPMARLDYADRYEFDWGVSNIRLFGRVHEDSHAALFLQYNSVWQTIRTAVLGQSTTASAIASSGITVTGLTAPAGTSHGPSVSSTGAVQGSSRGGTGSATSGTIASARALVDQYSSRNSGACTEQQMSTIILYLQEYARQKELRGPPTPNADQLRRLAREASTREIYIRHVRAAWQETEEAEESSDEEEEDSENESD